MRFGVTANPESPRAVEASRSVVETLRGEHSVLIEEDLAAVLGEEGTSLDAMSMDFLVTVGGDGTILRALQLGDFQILGVNISRVGFLTEVSLDGVEGALTRLAEGNFTIEERIKLRVEADGRRRPDCTNEAVIHTANLAKVRRFVIAIDGETASRVEGDGIIVATPTGSTAYSLSAGGPILDPRVRGFVITALAPFRQTLRPTVVPADAHVQVQLAGEGTSLLVLDGQREEVLEARARLDFTVAKRKARFVRFADDFYSRVREKLMEGPGP
ncbi:MAG: NAD(+)/NADH kinase [Candidatus Thermoplasmatota archaeon]|nr:NAD(+)/NADH kinase [Candidatus Thermoplasmatota archaeon]